MPQKIQSILLIDDDEINNFINRYAIQSLNIAERIFVIRNGEEGIKFLLQYAEENNSLPELIFIDINMPLMDGFEFMEKLIDSGLTHKFYSRYAVLTTSSNFKDREKFQRMGINHYINKPLSKEDIIGTLEKKSQKIVRNTFAVPIIPSNEDERIEAVRKYKILDTDPEQSFNSIVKEAANYFNVPIALVSMVDEDRVFFKANVGMPGITYTDRGMSLCSLAILKDELTVFTNAIEDPCLLSNPLVHGAFGLKFYAGAPITDSEGYHIDTVCIVDKKERDFSEADKDKLRQLASKAMELIEKRLMTINDHD